MKKLVILLFAAAVIGVVISKVRGDAEDGPQVEPGGSEAVASAIADEPVPEPASEPADAPQLAARSTPPAPAPVTVRKVPVNPPEAEEEPARPAEAAAVAASAPRSPRAQPLVVRARRVQPVATAPAPATPNTDPAVAAAVARASSLLKEGRRVEARKILSDLYIESRGQMARRLRMLLDDINRDLVFNPRCVEGAKIHVVQPGENLTKIGKQYGQSWQMIQRVNGMTHDRINVGQQLKILEGDLSCLVVLGEFRLTMLIDGVYAKEYPIGIGMDDKTPPGEFVVDTMLEKPRWYKPGGGVVEYGEEGHLLGERWIGFADQPGAAGLGIHGTNDESTVGTKCSNGCLRMRRDDVMELYDFMRRGSIVVVRP
jgi:hypothetical protein